MPTNSNSKEKLHMQSLVKEAMSLTQDLSEMDKKIEKDVLASVGAFAVWWEKNVEEDPATSFVADKVQEKGLEYIFENLFKILRFSKPVIEAGPGILVSVATSSRQPSYKMAYLDDKPEFAQKYEAKIARLKAIQNELLYAHPPSAASILQTDRCAQEACWRSN